MWSDTRFAPRAAKVIKAFISNLPVFVTDTEKQLASGDVKPSVVTELRQDIYIQMIKG